MGLTTTGAIYGVTTYGTEYYGASPTAPATFRWGVEIDWDGDDVFDGSNEAGRLLQIQCDRGRKNWLQPNGQGFYPVSVGVCHLTLDNSDGRYDAWNTSSPLYPNVTYGRDVRVRVVDVATDTVYPFFYGVISDIVPSGYGANAIVKITVEDGLRFLRNNYSYGLAGGVSSQTDKYIVEYILSDCGWKWSSQIGLGTTIPYYVCDIEKSALDNINEIAETTDVLFFIDATGKAKLSAKDSGDTYAIDESLLLKDIGNPFPYTNYRNIIKIYWSTYGSTSKTITTYPLSTASITSPITFAKSMLWVQNSTAATYIATKIGAQLTVNQKKPLIKLVNRPLYQFADIASVIDLTITSLGVNSSFALMGISHFGTPQEIFTTFYLEPT